MLKRAESIESKTWWSLTATSVRTSQSASNPSLKISGKWGGRWRAFRVLSNGGIFAPLQGQNPPRSRSVAEEDVPHSLRPTRAVAMPKEMGQNLMVLVEERVR